MIGRRLHPLALVAMRGGDTNVDSDEVLVEDDGGCRGCGCAVHAVIAPVAVG